MSKSDFRCDIPRLEEPHLADLKLAAAKMLGPARRAFEAEMVRKYCGVQGFRMKTRIRQGRAADCGS